METKKCKLLSIFILILFLLPTNNANGQRKNENYLLYIETFQDLAIEQMNRYKIPASITLAQAILESNAGRSTLAKDANNHFGIKCGSNWTGKKIYRDDDAKNECFRQYRDVKESYEDHSEFLVSQERYSKLFSLQIDDYEAWAKGLSECGYATDPSYAEKLIRLIELYELDQIKYNETISSDFKSQKEDKDIVHLQKKKKKADKPYYDHVVQAGESMDDISEKYGVQLSSLYKMNKKYKNTELTEGTVLRLR